jgi:hypothetical protein
MRRSMPRLLAVMCAGALLLAGCGGDDDGDASPVDRGDGTEEPSESTSESDDTTESTGGNEDSDGTGDPGVADFSSEECEQFAEAFDQSGLSQSITGASGDPTEQFEQTAAYLADAADELPEEIADDVEILADVYDQLAEASADIDWEGMQSGDVSAVDDAARLGQIYAANPEFTEAATNLSAYVAEVCVPDA